MQRLHHGFAGTLLAAAAVCVLSFGCQDPRTALEVARLEEQLRQTDSRLAVATTQVEAANEQVKGLKDSLEQSRKEASRFQQLIATERERHESGMAQIIDAARRMSNELADANRKLAEIERARDFAHASLRPIGVWVVKPSKSTLLGPGDFMRGQYYRFAFYDDGDVAVQEHTGAQWADQSTRMVFTPTSETAFRLDAKPGKYTNSSFRGDFVMESGSSGQLRVEFLPDEFGKPKWYPATLVDQNWQPPRRNK
jgi:hypothetical protein